MSVKFKIKVLNVVSDKFARDFYFLNVRGLIKLGVREFSSWLEKQESNPKGYRKESSLRFFRNYKGKLTDKVYTLDDITYNKLTEIAKSKNFSRRLFINRLLLFYAGGLNIFETEDWWYNENFIGDDCMGFFLSRLKASPFSWENIFPPSYDTSDIPERLFYYEMRGLPSLFYEKDLCSDAILDLNLQPKQCSP